MRDHEHSASADLALTASAPTSFTSRARSLAHSGLTILARRN